MIRSSKLTSSREKLLSNVEMDFSKLPLLANWSTSSSTTCKSYINVIIQGMIELL